MKRAAVVGLVAGVAAAVVLGAVAATWLLTRSPAPDAAARDFLEALAAGDGRRAVSLLESAPAAIDLAAVLDDATEHLSEPAVDRMDEDDAGRARAEVVFELAGETRTASFGLVQVDGGWKVTADALGAVTAATTHGDALSVGSALVTAGEETPLLPAVYTLHAAPRAYLTGEAPAIVLPGGSEQVLVEASVSSEATAAAQEQVERYLEDCAAPAPVVPENCGLRVPWAADLVSLERIAFRIEQVPALALAPDGRSFDATGGVIVATATGTTPAGEAASFTYRADDWAVRGSVTFTGDEMVLSVR